MGYKKCYTNTMKMCYAKPSETCFIERTKNNKGRKFKQILKWRGRMSGGDENEN